MDNVNIIDFRDKEAHIQGTNQIKSKSSTFEAIQKLGNVVFRPFKLFLEGIDEEKQQEHVHVFENAIMDDSKQNLGLDEKINVLNMNDVPENFLGSRAIKLGHNMFNNAIEKSAEINDFNTNTNTSILKDEPESSIESEVVNNDYTVREEVAVVPDREKEKVLIDENVMTDEVATVSQSELYSRTIQMVKSLAEELSAKNAKISELEHVNREALASLENAKNTQEKTKKEHEDKMAYLQELIEKRQIESANKDKEIDSLKQSTDESINEKNSIEQQINMMINEMEEMDSVIKDTDGYSMNKAA